MTGFYSQTRSVKILVAAVVLISSLLIDACCASAAELHRVRFGDHASFTRIVFDMQGERPVRIEDSERDKVIIEYQKLTARVQPSKLPYRYFKLVTKIRFTRSNQGTSIVVSLKPNTSMSYFYLEHDPPKPGWYRLVMDFSADTAPAASLAPTRDRDKPGIPLDPPPKERTVGDQPGKAEGIAPGETARPLSQKAEERHAVLAAGAKPNIIKPLTMSSQLFDGGQRKPIPLTRQKNKVEQAGDPATSRSSDQALVMDSVNSVADPASAATEKEATAPHEMIRNCENGIPTDPDDPQVPLLLFRCASAYLQMGDMQKCKEYLENIIADYPRAAVVPLSWMQLGRLQLTLNDSVGAVTSFRTALSLELSPADKLEANYQLGKALSKVNAHQDAIGHFQECLSMDPKAYLKHPDLLRYFGESLFAVAQYAESYRYLMHYINLDVQGADKDLVLARIAETLQHKGEKHLADKLSRYIVQQYPGTEGYVISQIRTAESLERGSQMSAEACQIYRQLAERPLSLPLMKVVFFKLAVWEWQNRNYAQSLSLVEKILQGRSNAAEFDEFLALKERIVSDWAKSAFANKDYLKVVELYKEYPSWFQANGSGSLLAAVAESYGQLKLYSRAIDIYRNLLRDVAAENDECHLKISEYAHLAGDPDTAMNHLAQVQSVALEPEKQRLTAEIRFGRGDYQGAVTQFDLLLGDGYTPEATDLVLLWHYAECLIKTDRPEDALEQLHVIHDRLSKDDAEQRVRLCLMQSECYEALKQPQQAAEMLEKAIALNPSGELKGRLNYQLSHLYAKAGQADKAMEKLHELMKSSQPFWQTAAQQKLDYLKLEDNKSKRAAF